MRENAGRKADTSGYLRKCGPVKDTPGARIGPIGIVGALCFLQYREERSAAEFVGTALLTFGMIGSGTSASKLSHGDQGFTLVVNALATGLVLTAIILGIGAVSGGQLNPAVTLVAWLTGGLSRPEAGASSASSGRSAAVPFGVGVYIAAAILSPSSGAFANPAATVGRSRSDTFAGIAPGSVPMFVIAQFVGAGLALAVVRSLLPSPSSSSAAQQERCQATDEPARRYSLRLA